MGILHDLALLIYDIGLVGVGIAVAVQAFVALHSWWTTRRGSHEAHSSHGRWRR
jgi:hypothetical protein